MPGILGIGIGMPFDTSAAIAGGGGPSGDAYLLETGDFLLLETGDFMLLE